MIERQPAPAPVAPSPRTRQVLERLACFVSGLQAGQEIRFSAPDDSVHFDFRIGPDHDKVPEFQLRTSVRRRQGGQHFVGRYAFCLYTIDHLFDDVAGMTEAEAAKLPRPKACQFVRFLSDLSTKGEASLRGQLYALAPRAPEKDREAYTDQCIILRHGEQWVHPHPDLDYVGHEVLPD